MAPRILRAVLAICLVMGTRLVWAQTVFNDGGVHKINGSSGQIWVENGSSLDIVSPALVSGPAVRFAAAVYGDSTSTIDLFGGQVFGPGPIGVNNGVAIETLGAFLSWGGCAIGADSASDSVVAGYGLVAGGSVQISGGTFVGGNGALAGMGALLSGVGGPVSITGGSFDGGNSSGVGAGEGLVLARSGDSVITGGSFVGGSGAGPQADSLFYQGEGLCASLSISGGLFSGPIEFDLSGGSYALNFLGSNFRLSLVNGQEVLTGILQNGSAIDTVLVSDDGSYQSSLTCRPGGVEELSFPGGDPPTPEPSSWLMLTTGACALAVAGSRGWLSG